MAIPSPAFTSADVASECGLTPPWASNAPALLAILADGAIPYTSADLAGRSSADYIPNAVDWANIASTTADGLGSNAAANASVTISGFNQTLTLQVSTTNGFCTKFGATATSDFYLNVYKNGVFQTNMFYQNSSTGASNGTLSASTTFTVVSGDVIYFEGSYNIYAGSTNTDGHGGGTFSVINQSSGNTVLDTFTVDVGASAYI